MVDGLLMQKDDLQNGECPLILIEGKGKQTNLVLPATQIACMYVYAGNWALSPACPSPDSRVR